MSQTHLSFGRITQVLCVHRQGEARMQADGTTEGSRAESDGGWDKRGGDGKEDSGSNLERASGTLWSRSK